MIVKANCETIVIYAISQFMNSIQEIVEIALKDGYLTSAMESELRLICDSNEELPAQEYKALDSLMSALLTGDIAALPQKQFINVMEELVVSEITSRIGELESILEHRPDIGDIAAYTLNRLPPLYATSEEGAHYQRIKALEEFKGLIDKNVREGINRFLDKPIYFPERRPIEKKEQSEIVNKVSKLLNDYAPEYEQQ